MNDEPTNQRITDKKGLTPSNQPTIKLINTPASDAAAKTGQWIPVRSVPFIIKAVLLLHRLKGGKEMG
jgi:hypothetical protein